MEGLCHGIMSIVYYNNLPNSWGNFEKQMSVAENLSNKILINPLV